MHWHVGYFNTRDNKFFPSFHYLSIMYTIKKQIQSTNIKNLGIYFLYVSLYFKKYNDSSNNSPFLVKLLIKATGTFLKFDRNRTKNLINTISLHICNCNLNSECTQSAQYQFILRFYI